MAGTLDNRTVVITGAGAGQGRAGAVLFAQEGARLALCDLHEEGLRETVALLTAEQRQNVTIGVCDVADPDSVASFVSDTLREHGGIDVVYNNAGVMERRAIEDTTEADWDRVFDVNVKGPFFMVKEAMPALAASSSGAVINVASISGLVPPRVGNTAYASSKGALMALTRAQARDLAPHGIRVNCLVPGPIDTAMPAPAFEHLEGEARADAMASAVDRNMIKRFGTSEEVAAVAVFLATPGSAYMTGAMIPVDGGWLAS